MELELVLAPTSEQRDSSHHDRRTHTASAPNPPLFHVDGFPVITGGDKGGGEHTGGKLWRDGCSAISLGFSGEGGPVSKKRGTWSESDGLGTSVAGTMFRSYCLVAASDVAARTLCTVSLCTASTRGDIDTDSSFRAFSFAD